MSSSTSAARDPDKSNIRQTMASEKSKGRLMLIGIAVVFIGPLVVSFILYFGGDWRPEGSTEHGELLDPVTLSDAPMLPGDDAPRYRGKWSVVYVGNGRCDEVCRDTLYETRQVRAALGQDRDRVQRVYVVTSGEPEIGFLRAEHPGLIVVTGGYGRDELLEAIGETQPGDTFVVDPIGNLMMRFPADTGMKGMKEDLAHLLKVSRIG